MFIRNRLICLCVSTLFALAVTPATSGQQPALPEQFTAFAVSTGEPRTSAGAGQVDISITRWSTEEESERFLAALKKGGHEGFMDLFEDVAPVGMIRSPGSLSLDLRYAHQEDLGDGLRRITLATDRPLTFFEAVDRPLSADYPFTVIELRVNSDGRGDGKLAHASAMTAGRSGTMIQVYNYDLQPVLLNDVRRIY
jgi:hypothetical protein